MKAIKQDDNVLIDRTIATLRKGFFNVAAQVSQAWPDHRGIESKSQSIIETFDRSKICVTLFRLT